MSQPLFFPVIDSHIHLWKKQDVKSARWYSEGDRLDRDYCIDEYREAAGHAGAHIEGFVYVEMDRVAEPEHAEVGWKHVHDEARLVRETLQSPGDDVDTDQRDGSGRCLAGVFWAPMPYENQILQTYIEQLKTAAGRLVRVSGFRYLLQDKKPGTMLDKTFVDNLLWLGEHGYTFDLGVTHKAPGQLDEMIGLMHRLLAASATRPEARRLRIVIDHMAKPKISDASIAYLDSAAGQERDAGFEEWKTRMAVLASFPNMHVKLSGLFSEVGEAAMPDFGGIEDEDFWSRQARVLELTERVAPWIRHCIAVFGPARCMFGSNWPIENLAGGGNANAWQAWYTVMRGVCAGLCPEDARMIWSGTAAQFYGIELKK